MPTTTQWIPSETRSCPPQGNLLGLSTATSTYRSSRDVAQSIAATNSRVESYSRLPTEGRLSPPPPPELRAGYGSLLQSLTSFTVSAKPSRSEKETIMNGEVAATKDLLARKTTKQSQVVWEMDQQSQNERIALQECQRELSLVKEKLESERCDYTRERASWQKQLDAKERTLQELRGLNMQLTLEVNQSKIESSLANLSPLRKTQQSIATSQHVDALTYYNHSALVDERNAAYEHQMRLEEEIKHREQSYSELLRKHDRLQGLWELEVKKCADIVKDVAAQKDDVREMYEKYRSLEIVHNTLLGTVTSERASTTQALSNFEALKKTHTKVSGKVQQLQAECDRQKQQLDASTARQAQLEEKLRLDTTSLQVEHIECERLRTQVKTLETDLAAQQHGRIGEVEAVSHRYTYELLKSLQLEERADRQSLATRAEFDILKCCHALQLAHLRHEVQTVGVEFRMETSRFVANGLGGGALHSPIESSTWQQLKDEFNLVIMERDGLRSQLEALVRECNQPLSIEDHLDAIHAAIVHKKENLFLKHQQDAVSTRLRHMLTLLGVRPPPNHSNVTYISNLSQLSAVESPMPPSVPTDGSMRSVSRSILTNQHQPIASLSARSVEKLMSELRYNESLVHSLKVELNTARQQQSSRRPSSPLPTVSETTSRSTSVGTVRPGVMVPTSPNVSPVRDGKF